MVTVVTSGAGRIRRHAKRAFLQFRKEREIVRAARPDPSQREERLRRMTGQIAECKSFACYGPFLSIICGTTATSAENRSSARSRGPLPTFVEIASPGWS